MDIMTKTGFKDLIGYELDDYWFERISMICDTFTDITDGDLSEIWRNDSLCVMEDLYESACSVDAVKRERDCLLESAERIRNEKDSLKSDYNKETDRNHDLLRTIESQTETLYHLQSENDELKSEISELRKEQFEDRIATSRMECGMKAYTDELEAQLLQYRAFVEDIKKAMKTDPLCLCEGDVCIKDIFASYGM